jgi:hypothetical protein
VLREDDKNDSTIDEKDSCYFLFTTPGFAYVVLPALAQNISSMEWVTRL